MRISRCAIFALFVAAMLSEPVSAQMRSRRTLSNNIGVRQSLPPILGATPSSSEGVVRLVTDDTQIAPSVETARTHPVQYRGLPPILPANNRGLMQDEKQGDPDIPNPPQTGDANQQIGPPLQVQSNAATQPDHCYEQSWCNLGCPKRLFCPTANGTEIGGWLNTGYHSDNNGLFNSHDDRSHMQQAWLFAERRARSCCGLDIGYRFDAVYGVDGQNLQAFGNPPAGTPANWDNSWDNGIYGWALPQAYVELVRNNLRIKVGKFFSPLGYESLASPNNFFYSRSFSRFHTNPFSHTGVLAVHDIAPGTQLYTGATLGWDTGFDQVNGAANYLGGIRFQPNGCTTVSYMTSGGDTGFRGDGWTHNLVVDRKRGQNVNTVAEINYQDLGNANEFSLANYMIYRVNECLGLGARFEWYKSERFTGADASTYSFTTGLNFRRTANTIIRPEIRVDWGAGAADPGQVIFGSDFIISF